LSHFCKKTFNISISQYDLTLTNWQETQVLIETLLLVGNMFTLIRHISSWSHIQSSR